MAEFISIFQVDRQGNEHTSSLLLRNDGAVSALGVISHGNQIRLAVPSDAARLVKALTLPRPMPEYTLQYWDLQGMEGLFTCKATSFAHAVAQIPQRPGAAPITEARLYRAQGD